MESQIGGKVLMNLPMFSYLWNKHCSELFKDVEMTEDEAKIVADVIIESYDEILRRIRENQHAKEMPGM